MMADVVNNNDDGAPARGCNNNYEAKVVVVLGATATGKTKLAIDLALCFGGEVINSDKIQAHDGLDLVTNKATAAERRGVPHHLIGGVSPDADYAATDFCRDAKRAVESVVRRRRVPIIAGGSVRYLQALLNDGDGDGDEPAAAGFRRRYQCCFLWVDCGDQAVLDRYIDKRVDCMLEQGLVREVRALFRHDDEDYSRGIRRAIGVPEMDAYFRAEAADDAELRARLLAAAVDEIKANTRSLARRQLRKIHRLHGLRGWGDIHRLDVTEVLRLKIRNADVQRAWETDVVSPAARTVGTFLALNSNKNGVDQGASRDNDKDYRRSFLANKEVAPPGGVRTATEWFGQQLDVAVISPVGLGSAAAAV